MVRDYSMKTIETEAMDNRSDRLAEVTRRISKKITNFSYEAAIPLQNYHLVYSNG